ncbi:hypothetical protein GJ496_007840 [Pomphorhynchus laevis]|nr:hypothetical protein GJ496_007840 [Pomphorhynchus laevis]
MCASFELGLCGIELNAAQCIIAKTFDQERQLLLKTQYDTILNTCEQPLRNTLTHAFANGRLGQGIQAIIKRIAKLNADKGRSSCSDNIRLVRCKIGYKLAKATLMCARAERSSFGNPMRIPSNRIGRFDHRRVMASLPQLDSRKHDGTGVNRPYLYKCGDSDKWKGYVHQQLTAISAK